MVISAGLTFVRRGEEIAPPSTGRGAGGGCAGGEELPEGNVRVTAGEGGRGDCAAMMVEFSVTYQYISQ